MCITGCHFSDHFAHCYTITDEFATFFHLPQNQAMSIGHMEKLVIQYAQNKGCVDGTLILYNKELWDLLKPTHSKRIKFYQLYRSMKKMVND